MEKYLHCQVMGNFNLEKAIKKWLKSFRKYSPFNHGSVREMELHLRDHIDDLVGKGIAEEKAFELAVKEFGDVQSIAEEELTIIKRSKNINSIINKTMLHSFIKIAFRNFWKYKFYSFLNLIGLAIGLSVVFLIALFVNDELSFDQYHTKKQTIYRVVENQHYSGQPVFPVAVTPSAAAPALEQNFPEVLRATRVSYKTLSFKQNEQTFIENRGILVDPQFLDMFSINILKGNVEEFTSDINSVLLTEELAEKYFPKTDPIGQTLIIEEEEYVISAVLENTPQNTHLPFRYVLNFRRLLEKEPEIDNNWGSNWLYTYIELNPEVSLETVNEKIKGLVKENNEDSSVELYLQPLTDIYLGSVSFVVEAPRKGQMLYVQIFFIVALFILIISCINFMNLATATSENRSREVGLRKTVGAYRSQLIIQFLTESILMSFIAVMLALLLVYYLLPLFNQISGKEFVMDQLFNLGNGWKISLWIVSAAFFTGLLSGIYPSIYLSKVQPVKALNKSTSSLKSGGGLRRILVVFQFTISVLLIIGTLVIFEQLNFIQEADLGYNQKNIAYTFTADKADVFAEELRKHSSIVSVGLANSHPGYVMNSSSGFEWSGKNPEESVLIHLLGTDENYLETMDIKVLQGRNFVKEDSLSIIINSRLKEIIGQENPVGLKIKAGDDEYTIVGVVKDFNFKSIHNDIEPLIIFKSPDTKRVYVRYHQGEEDAIKGTIENVWKAMFSDQEFNLYFLDTDFENMYNAEERTSRLAMIFSGLAIIISCLGLFGLVSYTTQQRTREIGIRKVLGASSAKLVGMLARDFTRLIVISLAISVPLSWYLMNLWLTRFAYRIDISVNTFVIACLSVFLISMITVSYQSIKTSLTNPVKVLNREG